MKKLAIYVHIPFCKAKCAYCDFLSFARIEMQEVYIKALIKEIKSFKKPDKYLVSTVFIGGGTPSLIDSKYIKEIIEAIKSTFTIKEEAEITIECNPGTVDAEKLSVYKTCGINRISFGLQSTDDTKLKFLGRIHTYSEFLESYKLALEGGFTNINIDIMSGLPYESEESFKETLKNVVSLKPAHISVYSLILEENTPLYKKVQEFKNDGVDILPDDETDRNMYHYTKEFLADNGYARYEISNYAVSGYECKHNISYWTLDEYIGFGLGSASYIDGMRFNNTSDLSAYIEHSDNLIIRENIENLTIEDSMWEYVMLGLRLSKGFSVTKFDNFFGKSFELIYGKITDKYIEQGFLERDNDYIKLTDKGVDVSNVIMADYMLT